MQSTSAERNKPVVPKIHFVSLFGVDLDYDIMVHWCRHYLHMGYDSYTVFLHTCDRNCTRYTLLRHAFKVAGFTVGETQDEPYTTQMRNDILTRFAKSLSPLDYLVVADSDEFHTTGPWASNFRDLIMSCDVLYGELQDRWADTLCEALPNVSLDKQYPYSGDVFETVLDKSDDPEKFRWRKTSKRKILACRAGLPIAHQGSHTLYKQDPSLKVRKGCIVDHYKWRHNILDRLKTKWYYNEGYERAVAEFFNIEQGVPA